MKNEVKHTAHSSYRCEYHIVFAPKYRRKEIYGKLRRDIGSVHISASIMRAKQTKAKKITSSLS